MIPFVGMTGGIGAGKSTAAAHFAALGVAVVDADEISRALTAPGRPAAAAVAQAFPQAAPCGGQMMARGFDRARLRALIFADDGARLQLEKILHPRIRRAMRRRMAAARGVYGVFVVPLLLEKKSFKRMAARILAVDCLESQQAARAAQRDGDGGGDIRRALAAQMPRAERLRLADDVLDNRGAPAELAAAVLRLHKKYLRLFGGARRDLN